MLSASYSEQRALNGNRPLILGTNHEIQARILQGNRFVKKNRMRKSLARVLVKWVCRAVLAGSVVYLGLCSWRSISTSPAFAIRMVEVSGTHRVSEETVRSMVSEIQGENLLALDLSRIQSRWSNRGWIRSLYLRRRPPSTLEVRVVERKPAVWLQARGGKFLVGEDGVIIDSYCDTYRDLELPQVMGPDKFRSGLTRALEFISQVSARPAFLARIKAIEATSVDSLAIRLSDVPYLLLMGVGGYVTKVDRYVQVEPLIKQEARQPGTINLAYGNQVVLSDRR